MDTDWLKDFEYESSSDESYASEFWSIRVLFKKVDGLEFNQSTSESSTILASYKIKFSDELSSEDFAEYDIDARIEWMIGYRDK